MSVVSPKKKTKPSGAQRCKAAAAALSALPSSHLGIQVGNFYVPWYAALAILIVQLLAGVIAIYQMM